MGAFIAAPSAAATVVPAHDIFGPTPAKIDPDHQSTTTHQRPAHDPHLFAPTERWVVATINVAPRPPRVKTIEPKALVRSHQRALGAEESRAPSTTTSTLPRAPNLLQNKAILQKRPWGR
ncbi:MAG: hypothetical protein JNL50_09745 [Phycisphaerae bacterium]|nr:hypothetical protein [Phycisphaerae bacterium]